jgi:hypothetical protein
MQRRIIQGFGEFSALTERHLLDARLLLAAQRPQGAVYLAGYAVECILKARISIIHGIKLWTRECLDTLNARAWSHDLLEFAILANTSPATLRRIHRLNWDSQLRYNPVKVRMTDGATRHNTAVEIVDDVKALIGIA